MSLIRKHGAVLQAWACLDLVDFSGSVQQLGDDLLSLVAAAESRIK